MAGNCPGGSLQRGAGHRAGSVPTPQASLSANGPWLRIREPVTWQVPKLVFELGNMGLAQSGTESDLYLSAPGQPHRGPVAHGCPGGSRAPGGRLEGVPLSPWAAGAQARMGLRFAHSGCSPAGGGLAPWGLFPHLSSLPSSTLSPCPRAPGWAGAGGGDAPPRACGPSGFTARRTRSVRVSSPGSPAASRSPGPRPPPCSLPAPRAQGSALGRTGRSDAHAPRHTWLGRQAGTGSSLGGGRCKSAQTDPGHLSGIRP